MKNNNDFREILARRQRLLERYRRCKEIGWDGYPGELEAIENEFYVETRGILFRLWLKKRFARGRP
jgi:hypothetical protein